MNTQIKRLIQLFCIMIMLFATLLPAIYSIQTAQASTTMMTTTMMTTTMMIMKSMVLLSASHQICWVFGR